MTSQPPGTAAAMGYRQDEDRRRDEARVGALQNQIDELRQAMRELASRQARQDEQFKQFEGGTAQNRLALDQFRQEAQQTAQARALDENRTRQQLSDLDARLGDAVRPIRSLQAHVSELLEVSRKKTDDTGQHQKRYDELRANIEHLAAHGDRTVVVTHQIRDSLDLTRGEIDAVRRDLIRTEDAIKIVDQEARRRMAEIAQGSENVSARIDEVLSDVAHLHDLIEETQRSVAHIDPELAEFRAASVTLRQDITRFQAQAIERHELTLQREEDVRQETDARFDELRQAQEQRVDRLTERLELLTDAHRDLVVRLSTLSHQLDELRQADSSLRREAWQLHEQRVRLRLEQAQHELDTVSRQRREAESGASVEATSSRPPGDL